MPYHYIEHQFCEYMIVQKLCTHRRIDIETVCQRMGVSAEDLTEYISERLGSSFSAVVHTYRIEEAKELWAKSGMTSIRKVARAVGYRNGPAFLFHFIKYEHCLPYTWKRRNLVPI